MDIAPHVRFIPNPTTGPAGSHPSNCFLVGSYGAALIDSGIDDDEGIKTKLDYLREVGVEHLAYIIITHAHVDHMGGAERIKEATGAQIVVGKEDEAAANEAFKTARVDGSVEEGDSLSVDGLTLEVIHTPGHSPGHICLYLREDKALFTGDHVVGAGTTAIAPPSGDMARYIDSLRKLLNYEAELLCPGHGPVVRVPRRKIQELIDHRLDREEQVLGLLRAGKETVEELVREIYPELDERWMDAARGQARAHLIKLEREGRVSSWEEGEVTRYSAK